MLLIIYTEIANYIYKITISREQLHLSTNFTRQKYVEHPAIQGILVFEELEFENWSSTFEFGQLRAGQERIIGKRLFRVQKEERKKRKEKRKNQVMK